MKTLFHGSYKIIDKPQIITSNRMLDYGNGFYTTADKKQAVRFTEKFIPLGKDRVVSIYQFDDENLNKILNVKEFKEADLEWLEYVVNNRAGRGGDDFDIVIGPVANDRVYSVVDEYELGTYTPQEAIIRLKTYKLTDQYVFKTKKALQTLAFKDSLFVLEE